jgi:hypothetical protein
MERVCCLNLPCGLVLQATTISIMQSFTPIRIRNPDKNGATAQQDDIAVVIADAVIVSHASDKVLLMVFGVIYGST